MQHDAPVFDIREVITRALKYLFEGIVVALAAFFIPEKKSKFDEIMTIALIAAATFSILDLFAPSMAASARSGAGFSIGAGVAGGVPVAHVM